MSTCTLRHTVPLALVVALFGRPARGEDPGNPHAARAPVPPSGPVGEVDWSTVPLVPACRADVVEAVSAVLAFAGCSNRGLVDLVDRSVTSPVPPLPAPWEETIRTGLGPLWEWMDTTPEGLTVFEERLADPASRAIFETRCEGPVSRWIPPIDRNVIGWVPGPVAVLGRNRYLVPFIFLSSPLFGDQVTSKHDARWYYVEAAPPEWWVLAAFVAGDPDWYHTGRSHRLDHFGIRPQTPEYCTVLMGSGPTFGWLDGEARAETDGVQRWKHETGTEP